MEIDCIFCKSSNINEYDIQKNSKGAKKQILICNSCKILFLNQSMHESESKEYIYNDL